MRSVPVRPLLRPDLPDGQLGGSQAGMCSHQEVGHGPQREHPVRRKDPPGEEVAGCCWRNPDYILQKKRLFPNLSLINHDCWPNCTVALNHGKIELRALGKISEGEELTISYVDFLNVSADRQKQLKERFHFDCSCDHCSQHISDDLMAAAAEGKVLKLCQECLKKQENVLADTHLYKLRVLSVLPEVLSYLRRFAEAAEFAGKMVEGYT
ncbi:hypothetical protein GOODEAATRI_010009 [Goodea atripinnis]|uniref:SET domain-containing protein n=1 Tax=Goodea atripinnis TaxID=208336 RepID=A0ABV0N9P7_9TELE